MIVKRSVILGATSLAGRELAERLRDRGVAMGALATCEPGVEANVLSAVAGDLIVSTSDVREAVDGADVVLVCAELPSSDAALVGEAGRSGAVVLDLSGTLEGSVVDPWGPATLASLGAGIHGVPTASSILIDLLGRSARDAGARVPLVATCCEPASELGRPALDELYEQALALLKFSPVPTAELGAQWAHDVVTPGKGGVAREARIRREVAALSGAAGTSLIVIRPGLFHGVAIAARADVSAAAWEAALRTQGRIELPESAGDDEVTTPAAAARSERAVIGRITDDGAGGSWAFAAADSLAFGAVGGAVALLERSTRVMR